MEKINIRKEGLSLIEEYLNVMVKIQSSMM